MAERGTTSTSVSGRIMSEVNEILSPFAIFQSVEMVGLVTAEHAFAHSGTFRYGVKAELPFFPQAFEVLRYDVADIFQGRYPVHV